MPSSLLQEQYNDDDDDDDGGVHEDDCGEGQQKELDAGELNDEIDEDYEGADEDEDEDSEESSEDDDADADPEVLPVKPVPDRPSKAPTVRASFLISTSFNISGCVMNCTSAPS
jgi:hypothetical protein